MSRPRLLGLFCGAGGAAMGYHRAGFDVVGVDIAPQPHYPFTFIRADAMSFPLAGYDAVHASPPCQHYSSATRQPDKHPDLYALTRGRLLDAGLPFVIENVIGAPYDYGFVLCGSMFNLRIRRHRNFETSWLQLLALRCDHRGERPIILTGHGGAKWADYKHSRHAPKSEWPALMDMPWAEPHEVRESIPPAYTEYIGQQLMGRL